MGTTRVIVLLAVVAVSAIGLWVAASYIAHRRGSVLPWLRSRQPPTEFVVPGQNRLSALLDVARTVVRRAERHALGVAAPGSYVVPYLNRLSDLLWTMARWQEGTYLPARERKA